MGPVAVRLKSLLGHKGPTVDSGRSDRRTIRIYDRNSWCIRIQRLDSADSCWGIRVQRFESGRSRGDGRTIRSYGCNSGCVRIQRFESVDSCWGVRVHGLRGRDRRQGIGINRGRSI